MPLYRRDLERVLIGTYREWLRRVGLDADTANGSNPDLNVAIEAALDARGVAITDRSAIADDDLAAIADANAQRTYADAKLATLELILGHWAKVDYGDGSNNQSLDQFGKRVQAERDSLMKTIAARWPLPTTSGGAVIGCMTSGRDRGAGGLLGWCYPDGLEPTYRWPGRLP